MRSVRRFDERNDLPLALMLAPTGVLGNGSKIVAEFRGALVAASPHFFNDRVFSHYYSPINSSGVQITGDSKPRVRITRVTAPSVSALAKCLQFHVNKTSIS